MNPLPLSYRTRATYLEQLTRERFDLLVIGGGITGAGVARDAALRGLRVALVERRDFAAGTSSRSSKLIHGGLRYLAQGDVPLVIEAANERRVLRRLAPHLARPIQMLVPVYNRRGYASISAALWTFDRIAKVGSDERNQMLGRDETLALEPQLRADTLYGGGVYYENLTDDARLVIETIKSAAARGALVVNYAPACRLVVSGGRLEGAMVQDALGGGEFLVRAGVVVNAAGPWVDDVRIMQGGGEKPRLHLTKGIHLIVPRDLLPVARVVVMQAPDKRATFVVPHGDVAYLGTTDTDYVGARDEPAITVDDAEYLLAAANATFAVSPLQRRHVVGAWAGLRPLLHQTGKRPSEISRKDEIIEGPTGLISIAGGKLTTYRKMAQRVVDLVAERLGTRLTTPSGDSADDLLSGGDTGTDVTAFAARLPRHSTIPLAVVERLTDLYGSNTPRILEAIAADPTLGPAGVPPGHLLPAEITYAVLEEMAMTLDDLLERRTRVFLWNVDNGLAAAPAAAQQMGRLLGWSEARVRDEVARYAARVHAVKEFRAADSIPPRVAHD